MLALGRVMISHRPFLISLLLVFLAIHSQSTTAHAQLMIGTGGQCRANATGCRPHFDLLWQGRRSGLVVRHSLIEQSQHTDAADTGQGSAQLRGVSLMYRLTTWRRTHAGWSAAVHTLTGIGDGFSAAWRGRPSRARADMGVEWEFARHGPDGRPWITAVVGLGLYLELTRDGPPPVNLRELGAALELTVQPAVSIRLAPRSLLGALW